jgi:hypothetical protein
MHETVNQNLDGRHHSVTGREFLSALLALNITPLSFLGNGGEPLPSESRAEEKTGLVKNVLTPSFSIRGVQADLKRIARTGHGQDSVG